MPGKVLILAGLCLYVEDAELEIAVDFLLGQSVNMPGFHIVFAK